MTSNSRIAIFASGNGTNAEEIFKRFKDHPTINVVLLMCNNPQATVLHRASNNNIPTKIFTKTEFADSRKVLQWLKEMEVTHIVLAGFLWLFPTYLVEAFPNKIVNIHPSLLPKFGGKGMYGIRVHEAVKQAGESETGITIHLVDNHYDEGRVLFQARCIVEEGDSPEQIAQKVQQLEYDSYPQVIEKWIEGLS